jgi:chloramphenicol-sensitive protein RarD
MAADPPQETLPAGGVGLAVSCYLLWGLVPIYWKAIPGIPAVETLIPRILWTLALLCVASVLTGQMAKTWASKRREWGWTLLAALLLAANWCLFIWAVQTDQVIATSLGYYINPLLSIVLGLVILGERLSRMQALAVAIAAIGVATLTISAGEFPWVSLLLATSFALYGLLHKMRPQPALAGLTREMLILSPIMLMGLAYLSTLEHAALIEASFADHAYLSLTGAVTAGPLLLFHAATKRLPLVAVGMFQYIAPTMTLALATFVYHETFTRSHAIGFGFVWSGLSVFSIDSVRRTQTHRNSTRAQPDAN